MREGQALLPGSDCRPADVLLPAFELGRDCALDVTVVSPMQQCLIEKAGEEPGAALRYAFERKMRQSHEACQEAGLLFSKPSLDDVTLIYNDGDFLYPCTKYRGTYFFMETIQAMTKDVNLSQEAI